MAKKVKRISVNALEKAVAEHCEKNSTVEWNGLSIEIQKNIGLEEMFAFVDDVASACFDSTGAYSPKRKKFMIRAAVVELYTNLSLPSSVKKQYDLLYGTDLFDTIVQNIDQSQLADIVDAINEGIKLVTDTGVATVTKKMDEIVNGFEKVGKDISDMFEGVDGSDINNVVRAVAENGIDEEKLMRAYLDMKEPTDKDVVSAV